jgi:RNA polymerase sigma-70 factor (family 1)
MVSEGILIQELKADSKTAFDNIYQMYVRRLLAFCYQFTKSSLDSEEIVQDVFLKLWDTRHQIRKEESIKSLLFAIARNSLINAYYSRVNSPTFEDYVFYLDELSVNDTANHLEYEDFVVQLNNAISKLPPTQQKILRLSKLEQKTNKEIAHQLSLSEQTVKNQLSLGLKALKKELSPVDLILFLLLLVN